MDGRIGTLHCRYRIAGDNRPAVAARLDRVVRDQLASACESALTRAFADAAKVIVIRRIDTSISLGKLEAITDQSLAARWSEQVAAAVFERAAAGGPDVVEFEDQSAFVASFIRDLLAGVAWDRWYYGAFASFRHRTLSETLRAVLQEQRAELPNILRRLGEGRSLDRLLRVLDHATVRELWAFAAGDSLIDRETYRPLVAQTLHLARALDLIGAPCEVDQMLDRFLASYPAPVDWRSSRSLTATLVNILRFMTIEGFVVRPSAATGSDFAHRLEQALASFDWTDVDWLRSMLLDLWAPASRGADSAGAERAVRSGATPKQRMLLADLLTVLRAGRVRLDAREPLAPANALRWYAALLAHAPGWSDDPLATALIGRLLVAWSTLDSSSRAFSSLELRSSGAAEDNVSPARAIASQLGEPAVAVLAALGEFPTGEGHHSAASIPTGCAGLFFLLRAIRDLRLPHLVARTAFPMAEPDENGIEPLSALLLGIGDGLAGPLDREERRSDPGLRLFANLPDEYESTAVAQVWDRVPPVGHEQFQHAMFATLAGQRLFDQATLRLERLSLPGGEVLLGGLAGTALWPFGCAFPHPVSIGTVVRGWVDAIEREMGIRPQVLVGPSLTLDTEPFARTLETSVRSVSGDSPEAAPSVTDVEILMPGSPGLLDARLTLALTGLSLVRAWARWLPRFAEATTPYLLRNFIRRQGEIVVTPDTIVIETDPGPLDVLLDMAGYRAEMEQVAWLGGRTVRFKS